jgi:hypothetical protein
MANNRAIRFVTAVREARAPRANGRTCGPVSHALDGPDPFRLTARSLADYRRRFTAPCRRRGRRRSGRDGRSERRSSSWMRSSKLTGKRREAAAYGSPDLGPDSKRVAWLQYRGRTIDRSRRRSRLSVGANLRWSGEILQGFNDNVPRGRTFTTQGGSRIGKRCATSGVFLLMGSVTYNEVDSETRPSIPRSSAKGPC